MSASPLNKWVPGALSKGQLMQLCRPGWIEDVSFKNDGIAVYCRAIDETIGEMRIHYAGFAHPFFGRERADRQTGTPLIFEVRGHDVKVTLTDGEKMARLIFYRMSEDCRLPKQKTRRQKSGYENQTLKLSEFFSPCEWL
jgi:deoxycytidine triphosphate deaminase